MDILDRYLIRDFLVYFVLILVGVVFLFLGVDFLSKFWKLQLPMEKVLRLYLYRIPEALQSFLPLAVLMAILFVVSHMSQQNEILALFSNGLGPLRIITTFVGVAAVLGAVSFLVFDPLVPMVKKKQMLIEQGREESDEKGLVFSGSSFWYRSGSTILRVGRFLPDENRLEAVDAYRLGQDHGIYQIIRANGAKYEDGDWILGKGFSVSYPDDTGFPIAKTFEGMTHVLSENPREFKMLKTWEGVMRLRELRRYIQRSQASGFDTTREQVHYHERIALVFTSLVFVLLAVPFVLRPMRTHSIAKSIGFCFMVVLAYKVLFGFVIAAGKAGQIPPVLAGWGTNVLFMAFAIFNMARRRTHVS